MNERDKKFTAFGSVAVIAAAGIFGYLIFQPVETSTVPTVAKSVTSKTDTSQSTNVSKQNESETPATSTNTVASESKSGVSDTGTSGSVQASQPTTPQAGSALTTTPTAPTTPTPAVQSGYRDGTYSSTISYRVPGGRNSLDVTVVVSAGAITSVTTTSSYPDRESASYIRSFESSLSSNANGQSLKTYSPSRIGSASLTTGAFRDALDSVRTQAA